MAFQTAKFEVGDKVRLNERVPKFLKSELRKRTHTISGVYYNKDLEVNLYEIHGVGKENIGYYFRGYMLTPVIHKELKKVGRPRSKRRYSRNAKN